MLHLLLRLPRVIIRALSGRCGSSYYYNLKVSRIFTVIVTLVNQMMGSSLVREEKTFRLESLPVCLRKVGGSTLVPAQSLKVQEGHLGSSSTNVNKMSLNDLKCVNGTLNKIQIQCNDYKLLLCVAYTRQYG